MPSTSTEILTPYLRMWEHSGSTGIYERECLLADDPASDRQRYEEAHAKCEHDRAAARHAPLGRDEQPAEPGEHRDRDAPREVALRRAREVARGRGRHHDH